MGFIVCVVHNSEKAVELDLGITTRLPPSRVIFLDQEKIEATSSVVVVESQRQKDWRTIPFESLMWMDDWDPDCELDCCWGAASHVAQDLGAFYEEYHNWPAKWGEDIFTTIFSYFQAPKPKAEKAPYENVPSLFGELDSPKKEMKKYPRKKRDVSF